MTAPVEVEVWECIPPTEVCFPPTADLDTPKDFLVHIPADKALFTAAFWAQTTVDGDCSKGMTNLSL
jgi:hypothetical protein